MYSPFAPFSLWSDTNSDDTKKQAKEVAEPEGEEEKASFQLRSKLVPEGSTFDFDDVESPTNNANGEVDGGADGDQEVKPKPKGKRGRRPSAEKLALADATNEVTPPKKRGRKPRKKDSLETEGEEPKDTSETPEGRESSAKKPGRRGRKKKQEDEEEEEAAEEPKPATPQEERRTSSGRSVKRPQRFEEPKEKGRRKRRKSTEGECSEAKEGDEEVEEKSEEGDGEVSAVPGEEESKPQAEVIPKRKPQPQYEQGRAKELIKRVAKMRMVTSPPANVPANIPDSPAKNEEDTTEEMKAPTEEEGDNKNSDEQGKKEEEDMQQDQATKKRSSQTAAANTANAKRRKTSAGGKKKVGAKGKKARDQSDAGAEGLVDPTKNDVQGAVAAIQKRVSGLLGAISDHRKTWEQLIAGYIPPELARQIEEEESQKAAAEDTGNGCAPSSDTSEAQPSAAEMIEEKEN